MTWNKALMGAVTAALGAGGQAVAAQCGHPINWAVALGTTLLALGAVYFTPNAAAKP
jgi:hypothetical protein